MSLNHTRSIRLLHNGFLSRCLTYNGQRYINQFRFYSSSTTFKEGDRVIIHSLKQSRSDGYFTKPLTNKGIVQFRLGEIKDSEIIGRNPQDVVRTSTGTPCRIVEPTLAEYVCLTRRLVTPIYPDNTNILTSLLDLHPPDLNNRVDILEAGTGHGALTLHLARAIHGANQPQNSTDITEKQPQERKDLRNAVIHTLDISEKHSKHAEKVIKGFRRGIYHDNIDFHIGDLPAFFDSIKDKPKRFLTHIILDMPSSDDRLSIVANHMRDDAVLLVFNPSVSQISNCIERIAKEKLPLQQEQVLELAGSFSGGREWDVRLAKIKNPSSLSNIDSDIKSESGIWSWMSNFFSSSTSSQSESIEAKSALVCRPKAGQQISVGGFVGVWRRIPVA